MAMIYQSAASASNANKITISMWCRTHTTNEPSESGDQFTLLEFGNPSGISDVVANSIVLVTNVSSGLGGNHLLTTFAGRQNEFDGINYCTTTNKVYGASGNPYGFLTNFDAGTGDVFTAGIEMVATNLSNVLPGQWFHLLIAADFTNETSVGGECNTLYVMINGVVKTLLGQDDSWGYGRSVSAGKVQPALLANSTYPYWIQANGWYYGGPFSESGGVGDSAWTTTGRVPGFSIDLNGFEIGIPSQVASPNKNTQLLDMADVQIWVGKYIDPTNSTNFSKFVDVNELGGGTPVNPDIAADYFGQQTYLFTGTRDDFLVNQGSGGAFSYSGTITDSSGVAY